MGDPGSLPSSRWHCRQKTGRLCGSSFPGQPLLCFSQDGPKFRASMTRSPPSPSSPGVGVISRPHGSPCCPHAFGLRTSALPTPS